MIDCLNECEELSWLFVESNQKDSRQKGNNDKKNKKNDSKY